MADKVVCPNCSLTISRANLRRHCRVVHGEPSSQQVCRRVTTDTEVRSRSSSRDTAVSDTSPRVATSRSVAPAVVANRPLRSSSYLLMDAVRSLLEQHHLTTEEEMCEFLRINFVEIPEHELYPLVVGAVAGAQYAANFHFITERNKVSRDANKREIAINAGSSLSFWNLGFGSSMRPSPGIPPSTDVVRVPQQDASPSLLTAVQPLDLQFPVSYSKSCADFDVLEAAVVEAGIHDNSTVQTVSEPATVTASSAVDPENASPRAVEPYVPVALSVSTDRATNYRPTPSAELKRAALSTVPQSQPEEEPELVISVDPEEIEPLVEGDPSPSSTPTTKDAQLTSASVASSVVKPDAVSNPREKKAIDVHEYRKRRSEDRLRNPHPRSRTPPYRRSTVPRWAPRGSSGRSPRNDRRDESPPRRLVLTGPELQEFLRYKDRAH